jgi:hypothetical protein
LEKNKTLPQDAQKARPARPQQVKQAEVKVKVEQSSDFFSQPQPEP